MSKLTNQNVHYMFSIVCAMWLLLQIMYGSTKDFTQQSEIVVLKSILFKNNEQNDWCVYLIKLRNHIALFLGV